MGALKDAIGGISGKDALKGLGAAFGGISGLEGNGINGALGGLSGLMGGGGSGGLNLMNMLFDQLGIFGGKKKEEPAPSYAPTGVVGPR